MSRNTKPNATSDPWETCLNDAKRYLAGDIEMWKDGVQNLLIFAGLFSGVVTAFSIESYHSLRADPAEKTVLLLRALLEVQYNATRPQPNIAPINFDPQIPITAAARRIGIYNFLSLTLSLIDVMIGILCLQWLREYGRIPDGMPGSRRDELAIYFMRYKGMEKWQVFTILTLLPLILLFSLLLFFAGIIELLLDIDAEDCASVASVFIGFATAFMLITTLLPTFQSFFSRSLSRRHVAQCPYKSPQARIAYRLVRALWRFGNYLASKWRRGSNLEHDAHKPSLGGTQSWSDFDWLLYNELKASQDVNLGWGLHWIGRRYMQSEGFAEAFYQCIRDATIHHNLWGILSERDPRRWEVMEKALSWRAVGADALQVEDKYKRDMTIFQTLAHMTERDQPSTACLDKRVKLFLKIKRLRPDGEVDCPVASSFDWENLISDETRQSVLEVLIKTLQQGRECNATHISAIDRIIALKRTPIAKLNSIQEALEGWKPKEISLQVDKMTLLNHIRTLTASTVRPHILGDT
ncbi:hypothetical protein NP233_g11612 [Leucocoprinus birnbaumii]|uniref:DUF6535 domain-containing protein n=1 Tax=Leucocoprinus birnbaumii TaxID=56174 RepID=A0AAD5VG40_9AGAR|nr:hypothetical protein NP233_g11612 [Leucocoprinus birnbaumii]